MEKQNAIKVFNNLVNQDIFNLYEKFPHAVFSGCGNHSSKAFIVSDLFQEIQAKNLVWVLNNSQEKNDIKKMLQFWTDAEILDFEIKDNNYSDKHIHRENLGRITHVISQLSEPKKQVILTTYEDWSINTPDPVDLERAKWEVKKGDEYTLVNIFEQLINMNLETAKDAFVNKGQYYCQGNLVKIFPYNLDYPVRIEVDFEEVVNIDILDHDQKTVIANIEHIAIYPVLENKANHHLSEFLNKNDILLEDEIELTDDAYNNWSSALQNGKSKRMSFHTFNEDEENHIHLYYASVIKFHTIHDFVNELKDRKKEGWKMVVATHNLEELKNILNDKHCVFFSKPEDFQNSKEGVLLLEVNERLSLPHSFQNPDLKIAVISDRDIAQIQKDEKSSQSTQRVYLDLLTSLKLNDLVVHADHGIARFLGLDKKEVDGITKEYLKLGYAENDKLFVPVDQADRVSKYIGSEEIAPKLTRLGSAEWTTIKNRVKAETQKIAKELLKLYASREAAKGIKFAPDTKDQVKFEASFPYEETPGQIKAILDVKKDMEQDKPMDRLVCGDVGFGKTEVAMRAAFKAVQSGKQVAFISPITILADQHYQSFKKRMDEFHIRVELLSRFKTPKEQKETLKRLEKGEVDIVIGTHRLLQEDVIFKDLGLVMVDEEQRFGVKQKETLKKLRKEVDILTLTATPIPRTLNLSLNKLRDISTITTPPPGRLPVVTEVRKYSAELIREAIMREIERGGQAYILHNRVQTIESFAETMRKILPEARFIVAHGKLSPPELEKRIIAFKNGEFDVLVSSTIIENGIDLSNANTLIVNNSEKFGLSQLYQLRGRVGRSKKQAYAYFLYHGQRLKLDAKKRLRAIVEASELGSGFQIAMKDLEIRGAGEILGASQSGTMNVVGASHFIRMLNKAVEDLKSGRTASSDDEPIEVSIELPINAFIPDEYIPDSKDKIAAYQRLSSADGMTYLAEIKDDLENQHGRMPAEVANLFRVIELKLKAKKANLTNIKAQNSATSRGGKQIVLTMSDQVRPANIMNMLDHNDKWKISGTKLMIHMEELGAHWFTALVTCIEKLAEEIQVKK